MKNIRVFIIAFFISLTSVISFSQVWLNGIEPGSIGDEKAFAVTIDQRSNIYVTGYSSGPAGGINFCTIKYDKDGVQQWVAIYNGQGNGEDKAYAITVDKFDNVYVTGYSTGVTSTHDITTIKYNSSGVQQWAIVFDGPGSQDDEAYSIALDKDANVYVAGFVTGRRANPDICTIKYNTNGVQQWVNIYNGQGNGEDKAYAITIDKSDDVYVTGYSTCNNIDYTTIKYNSGGVQQWIAFFNGMGNGEDKAYAITVDKNEFVYITGYSTNLYGSTDYATVEYNSSGVQEWVAYYDGPAGTNNKARAIAVDKKGNVYVTGASDSTVNGNPDYATIKYNSSGVQQWVARYNGGANSDDIANSLVLDNGEHEIYITGQSKEKGFNSLRYHYATLKYSTDGVKQWEKIYTAAKLDDIASQLVIDNQGNAYITGYSYSSGRNCDYATLKYNASGVQQWVARYDGLNNVINSQAQIQNESENSFQPDGTNAELRTSGSMLPLSFMLYQNFPNPFNPSTAIRYDVPKESDIKIVVYNILGEIVTTLVDERQGPGKYEVVFHPYNLGSGVYFFEMTTVSYREIKKMLFIK